MTFDFKNKKRALVSPSYDVFQSFFPCTWSVVCEPHILNRTMAGKKNKPQYHFCSFLYFRVTLADIFVKFESDFSYHMNI